MKAFTFFRHLLATAIALAALAGMPAAAAASATPLGELAARLESARAIHADFAQTKTLAALKRPLRTEGRIVFVRGEGVLWRVDKPYQATYALTAETVTEVGPDGVRKVRPAKDVPALAHVGRVFEGMFAGKLQKLEEHFEVTVTGSAREWRIDLTPKPALAAFLKGIRASGGEFLERIEVSEARGDLTRIEFTHSRLDAPLSDADLQLLRNP